MTTEQLEPEEPGTTADSGEAANAAVPELDDHHDSDDDDETDAMGLNDNDPIDATLAGKPVEEDEE